MKDKLFALFSKIGVDSVNDLVHVTDQVKHLPFSPPSRTGFTHVHISLTYFTQDMDSAGLLLVSRRKFAQQLVKLKLTSVPAIDHLSPKGQF